MRKLISLLQDWQRARYFNTRPVTAQILQQTSGVARPSQAGRCCIFAHYDPDGIVDPYVVEYLRKLRDLDADILFVTTSETLAPEEVAKIAPLCREIIQRVNVSLDFGSWNLGIRLLGDDLSNYRQLILSNDSVYGPFRALDPIFREMEARQLDFWGLTESHERGQHIQSYFLVFEKSAIGSEFFRTFWEGFRQQWRKRSLIGKYEVGLSSKARQNSLRFESWISSDRVGSGQKNPTLFFWEKLIRDFGYPFLKTEILKINRFDSPYAQRWREIIAACSAYNNKLIANHLRRVGSAVEPPAGQGQM
jgi:lipopolysaccharide biosynthesis protein